MAVGESCLESDDSSLANPPLRCSFEVSLGGEDSFSGGIASLTLEPSVK
jgi:hypothetical protein